MDLCIECKKEPVYIKKRQLCKSCYGRLQRSGKDLSPVGTASITKAKWHVKREIEFIKNYFNHNNWVHHPAFFHLGDEGYAPDFYDGETNTFIEVSGTRQAHSLNQYKYDLFRKLYPKIKFEIRLVSGELLDETISINSQMEV